MSSRKKDDVNNRIFADPNIEGPNSSVKSPDAKQVLAKLVSALCYRMALALIYYHATKPDSADANYIYSVKCRFAAAHNKCQKAASVLENIVATPYVGITGAIEAVYGKGSKELAACQESERLYACMDSWNEAEMWTNPNAAGEILSSKL